MALTDKLSAIGDAIREKTGKTDLIPLDDMPAEIRSIKSGGSVNYNPATLHSVSGTSSFSDYLNGTEYIPMIEIKAYPQGYSSQNLYRVGCYSHTDEEGIRHYKVCTVSASGIALDTNGETLQMSAALKVSGTLYYNSQLRAAAIRASEIFYYNAAEG